MATPVLRPALAPRVPLDQLGAGSDGQAVLVQQGGDVLELVHLAFASDSPRRSALELRLRRAAAIDHPALRGVIAVEDTTIVLHGDRDPLLADLIGTAACGLALVTQIAISLADVLAAVHLAGAVHGQLHPWAVHVTDRVRIELTGLRTHADHPWIARCIAPELEYQVSPDAASDMYALGALLELCVGARDAAPELRAVIDQLLDEDPDRRPTAAVVKRRLAPKPRVARETLRDADVAPRLAVRPTLGLRIGRFELARQIGVGSTGEVWAAHDRAGGPDVAIKVLKPEIASKPELLQRFRKEARVLELVGSPYVANVIDLNEDRGLHYLVLELVEGGTVATALKHLGKLPEAMALAIISDACRALDEPHRRGIVHRDVKPDNLMFVRAGQGLEAAPKGQLVKLGDFGIARLVETRSESGTGDGIMLGTPEYMAPEQCQARPITPATDVYGLACSLFTMIAGRPPFEMTADGQVALILRLVAEAPPVLSMLIPDVSPAVNDLVARCLSKDPQARLQDAGELLAAIEQLMFGSTALVVAHPAPPVVKPQRIQTFAFQWELASSPEALWPHVSNTEKMNRAAGLAAVEFDIEGDRTIGRQKVAGVALEWQEHPYEWIEGTRHSVLRTFDHGVLRWYTSEVTLERLPNGGTRLRNIVQIEPRSFLGRLISKWQIGISYKRKLDQIYRRIDGTIFANPAPGIDPISPDIVIGTASRARLEKGRVELGAVVDERAADAVIDHLSRASDQDVARIRPLQMAQTYGVAEEAVVAASLHAARLGLVEMVWDVICPSCRIPSTIVDSLAKIEEHATCKACNLDYKVDFSRAIELAFRAAPTIRDVETKTFCIGSPGNFSHIVAQIRLQPHERYVLPLRLAAGYYVVRTPQLTGEHDLRVVTTGGVRRVDVTLGDRAVLPALTAMDQLITLTNNEARELVVRVERAGDREHALTAAQVMANATFRELFPDQQLAPGRLMSITQTTLVVAQLEDAAKIFATLGDSKAFPLATQFFELVGGLAKGHGGSVVKTFGGMAIAAFERPTAALDVALALHVQVTDGHRCSVAVHRGPMMALSQGGRLDYFGENVERAISALPRIPAGAIGLTEMTCRDVAVAERLATTERIGLEVLADGGWIQHVRARQ